MAGFERGDVKMNRGSRILVTVGLLLAASGACTAHDAWQLEEERRTGSFERSGTRKTQQLSMLKQNFFDEATRSINHDKRNWDDPNNARGPRLGGKQWERKNQRLEDDLEQMSNSVNVMFKDQGNKRRYQRDEDKLFREAVSALKTADELYPDSPTGGAGSSRRHADSDFGAGGRRARDAPRPAPMVVHKVIPLPQPPRSLKFRPNMTEVLLILSGCTLLAAASWVGFTFFRRKHYYDLRGRGAGDRDRDGIELP